MKRVDGLLLLNKPAGMTSNRALQTVRRLLRAKKAGHTGSLDPSATGMLPLCFGEATKVCGFLLDADKTYRVTAKLGVATDTGDADGEETATAAVPDRTSEEWNDILQGFLGDSMQVPPMYSALKKDGKRLYEMARKGETVEREARPIRIDEIQLLEAAGTRLVFRVQCSKGTYIRALVEDIAAQAGTVAHTARLHREAVGGFRADAMLDMTEVESLAEAGELQAQLLTADVALPSLPAVHLDGAAEAKFRGGQAVEATADAASGLARVYGDEDVFVGVGELSGDGKLQPRRIFLAPQERP